MNFLTLCRSTLYPPPIDSANLKKISSDGNQPHYQRVSESINAAKCILMILVLLGHVSRPFTSPEESIVYAPRLCDSPLLSYFTGFAYSFNMPAFFAMSGAVYFIVKMVKRRYDNTPVFVGNKAKRLLLPYLFFAVAMTLIICHMTTVNYSFVGKFREFLLMGRYLCHLWFLPTLFFTFVIFNFLNRYFVKHILVNLILLGVVSVASDFLPISALPFQLNLVCHYMFYFYLGYVMCYVVLSHEINAKNCAGWSLIIFAALLAVKFFTLGVPYFPLALSPLVAIAGTFAVFFGCYAFQSFCRNKYVKAIADYSFGIYLFHPAFLYMIFYFMRDYEVAPMLLFVATSVAVFVVSILLTRIFRATPFLAIFIGEKYRKGKR